jgi:predicted metal-dependent phosphoesterase TrpH
MSRAPRPGKGRIWVDLHIHTCYSSDCLTSLDQIVEASLARRLGGVAVLDHNTIEGALELQKLAPFPVIVGEEVYTTEGEVGGLFLRETVPAGLSARETVSRIRVQGGLVYVPHPFDRYRRSPVGEQTLLSIVDSVDVIEVLNARVLVGRDNAMAQAYAHARGILCGAGSDAHSAAEIGRAFVDMPAFCDLASFVRSLSQGVIRGQISGPHVHLYSTWAKLRRRLGG